ncbi:MAG: ubiquinol-cytochrome C chaperone family protein [Hyphomicrobiales bacterium]
MVLGLGFLKRSTKGRDLRIRKVYDHLVLQARLPDFYQSYQVADTVSGRFDMIVLHAFLFFQRLKGEGSIAKEFGQEVFDIFFEDMDRSLRELGVGYQAVPKRIKKMGEAFYGRVSAYDAALDLAVSSGDISSLSDALHRNIFPDVDEAPEAAASLANYMIESVKLLGECDLQALYEADFTLPNPDQFLLDSTLKKGNHA